MTKYTRVTGKVFGASADPTGDNPEIGQFGSALATTYLGTNDISTIQSLPAWSNGFIGCVTPNTQFPPLPEMTGFGKVLSQQICYLLQQGIAEWDSGTIYYTGNWCSYNNELYFSIADGHSGVVPTDVTKWSKFIGSASRNLGEIVTSSLPLNDNTLHLADGSLLSASNYPEFVSYVANLYNSMPSTIQFSQATQNATLGNNDWRGIAYGNGKFVAVNGYGEYSVSLNGVNWTNPQYIDSPAPIGVASVIYAQGQFVVFTQSGIYTSSDTETWTAAGYFPVSGIKAAAFGNGVYTVLVEVSGLPTVYTAYTTTELSGNNWVSNTLEINAQSVRDIYDVIFSEGRFVAIAKVGSGNTKYAIFSNNGVNWTGEMINSLTLTTDYQSLVYDGVDYILIKSNGATAYSSDLINWSETGVVANLGNRSWIALGKDNEKIVALSSSGYLSNRDLPIFSVFTTEENWQATYTAYGECGKYVYNSTNNTVRIPLYNSYFRNTTNQAQLGGLTPASIPNIKGVFPASENVYKSGTPTPSYGAFELDTYNVVSGQSDNTHFDNDLWNFDASRVSNVYSDTATTVNTQSIKQLVYIVVAK